MTSNNKKPFLSAALIVKNEEHNIRRCLDSLKDVCDEIIVVDTGSTDKTPEIVREYTDKLYFHEWQGSFSEARNFSFKFPKGEWVLYIDADEELSKDLRITLRKFLLKLEKNVNTVNVPMKSYLDVAQEKYEVASMPRIFRNGTVYFENIVHNQPRFKPKVVSIKEEMIHYGYIWTRGLRAKKYERMKSMLEKHLKEEKGSKEEIYYLCQLLKAEIIGKKNHEVLTLGMRIFNKLKEDEQSGFITPIAFEILYILSMQLLDKGYIEQSREVVEFGLEKFSSYPDLHLALLFIYYETESYREMIKHSEAFFKTYRNAMINPDKFPISVTSINYFQIVYLLIANAYLKAENLEKFQINLRKSFSESVLNTPKNVIQGIIQTLANLSPDKIRWLKKEIVALHKYCQEKNINVSWRPLIETIADQKIDFDYFIQTNDLFYDLAAEKIVDQKKDFFISVLFGKYTGVEYFNKFGHLAFITYYQYLKEYKSTESIITEFKNYIPDVEHNMTKAIIYACIGDCYLEEGDFKQAIANYGQALQHYPDLSKFIKPILEDLTIELDASIEGVFAEIKRFFIEKKELIFDFTATLPQFIVERLYLISDFYLAIYTSAITQKVPKKGLELLDRIESKADELPFYYYHKGILAFQSGDSALSKELLQKTLNMQPWLGDIKNNGRSAYAGYYFEKQNKYFSDKDEIVWMGNISKLSSLYGVINPNKIWRINKEGLIYSENVPEKSAIEAYAYQMNRFGIKAEKINLYLLKKVLSYFPHQRIHVVGLDEDEEIEYLFKTFSIKKDNEADKIVIFKGIEENENLEDIIDINKHTSGMIIANFPVNKTYHNPLWYDPLNVCYRSSAYFKNFFQDRGFSTRLEIQEKHNLIFFDKGDNIGD